MEGAPHVVFVGGLPGSGKSCLLRDLEEKGYKLFDDFQSRAHGNVADFTRARRYPDLVRALRDGRRCVVADVRVVTPEYRADAERVLREEFHDLELEWQIFDNEPVQCEENIRRSEEGRLSILKQFKDRHVVPDGVTPIPVFRKPG